MALDPITLGITGTALGAAQSIYGMTQAREAKRNINAIKAAAPSLSTPAEYYDALKKAYDDRLLQMQYEDINRTLATSTEALKGAGGAALVGGLNEQVRGAARQRDYLTEQQNLRQNQALQALAGAREREIGRREQRSQTDLAFANQQLQAANQQIAGGASAAAENLAYTALMGDGETPIAKGTKVKLPRKVKPQPMSDEDYFYYG